MRSALLVLLAAAAVSGACSGVPEGRLGASDPSPTAPSSRGDPVSVVNTTTTGPVASIPSGTDETTVTADGDGTGSSSGSSSGRTTSTSGDGDEDAMTAMLDCLRRQGIRVPEPTIGPNGQTEFDEKALSQLGQDPAVQQAAQTCSDQIRGGG